MSNPAGERPTGSAWSRFWNRGRWWKAIALAVAYLVIFEVVGLSAAPLVPFVGDADSASFVLVLYAFPLLLGCLVLIVFGLSVGWVRELFRRHRIPGHGWMWIAIAAVLVFNVFRFATTDYSRTHADWVLAWLLTGLLIGFAEEVLTRGYVVRIMRSAGHSEIMVALASAGVFALLHSVNLLSGQALGPTLVQLVYTFFFGICMYLALRVTRTIIAPVLLHASTDASIFMQSAHPLDGPLPAIAGLGNIVVILVGFVLLIVLLLTRGRDAHAPAV